MTSTSLIIKTLLTSIHLDKFSPDDQFIREIFKEKCVKCRKSAYTIHEIVPRSKKIDWYLFTNRVLVCYECHDTIHSNGAMNFTEELEDLWRKRLEQYYDFV